MIPRLLIVAIFLSTGVAHAEAAWGPTGRDPGTSVEASGDPLAPDGARVRLSARAVGPQGFAGADHRAGRAPTCAVERWS